MIAAIHVRDVQRAVGRIGEVDGAEALVGRREEFSALSYAFRARSVVPSSLTMIAADEVGGRLRDEHVAIELRRQPVAAIHQRRADGGEPRQRCRPSRSMPS